MIERAIQNAKNVSINDIKFDANQIVLIKETTRVNSKTGEVNKYYKYAQIADAKSTDNIKIMMSVLKVMLAEYKSNRANLQDFEEAGETITDKYKSLLSNNCVVWKTDTEGKLSKAIVSEIPFSQTALKLKDKHTLINCKAENLKAALYTHSKVILAQCCYFSLIASEVAKIDALLSLTDKKEEEGNKDNKVKVTRAKKSSETEAKQVANG